MPLLSHVSTTDANKSRVEIAAANNLRKLYDSFLAGSTTTDDNEDGGYKPHAALSPQRSTTRPKSARLASKPRDSGRGSVTNSPRTSAIDAVRSLRQQRHHHQSSQPELLLPTRSPSKSNYVRKAAQVNDDNGATVFNKWISLTTTISSLEANVSDLKHELKASKVKCTELQQHARLAIDTSDLDPKLQCLEEILGHENFQRYLNDLNTETASFRARFALYSRRFQWFQQRVWETHDKRATKATCLDILNRAVANSSSTSRSQPGELVVLLSQYPVLFQHCLDTQDPERIVLTELLKLLSAIPAGRERLLRHLFEQIADARRGEGAKPPPDLVRPHKLTALAKQSLASGLCSKQEFDEVEKWLDTEAVTGGGEKTTGVSLHAFLKFHIQKSDAFRAEDAEFVTYLMRLWSFQITSSGQDACLEDIVHVLKSYEMRCQLKIAATRKKDLVLKIQNALSIHLIKFTSLEAQIQQLQVLQLNRPPVWKSIQNDARLAVQCGTSLTLLKTLTLSSQCLQVFPEFITSLTQLEVLDLTDNLISALPIEIEQLTLLQRLALSSNRLTDKSFHGLDTSFSKLSALCDLRLDCNQLTSLPRAIPAIPSLTALDLSQNQLKTLPQAVVQQWGGENRKCQLVAIDLHQNALTSLPEELSVLSATLRHLVLHENKLETLPASITLLLRLETLTLSYNTLGSSGFPAYPMTLEQRHITLDHNQLRQFPAIKHGVKLYLEGTPSQVQSINASWNRLRSIPPMALGSLLPLCEELNLCHNSLQELPEDLFLALPGLRVCKLGANQLQRLPDSILGCTRLHVLDVQQNRLQTLPVELAQQLTSLAVLNAMENQLIEVPVAWHAFASHCDIITGKRNLQTLALKKNPIRSKVLKTIIDGGSVDVSVAVVATTKPNDEQLCGFAVKKVVDALHNTLEVLAMETEGVCGDDEDEDFDTQEARGAGAQIQAKRQWKGMTRNVVKYLEQRLQRIQAAEAQYKTVRSDSRLLVSERAFRRLLKSLSSTCSEKEMASLVSQFKVSSSASSGESVVMVSGSAFLLAIDQFGQHRTLSTAPTVTNSSFAISKSGDPVASLLHYLSLVHCQQQQRAERLTSPVKKKNEDKAHKVAYVKKNKLRTETHQSLAATEELKASTSSSRHQIRQKQQIKERETQAKNQFLQRHLDPEHEVLMRRQKQRIQILEQQLLDQKLLLLSQQQQQHTQASKRSELGLANGISDDEDSEDHDDEPQAGHKEPKNQDDSSVLVCIKCVKGQEHLPVMQRWKSGPLSFSTSLNAPITAVKQAIERETQIPIASQVLISAPPGGGPQGSGVPVRVRNDAVVKEYLEILTVESKMKWHLTLLVGESLRVAPSSQ